MVRARALSLSASILSFLSSCITGHPQWANAYRAMALRLPFDPVLRCVASTAQWLLAAGMSAAIATGYAFPPFVPLLAGLSIFPSACLKAPFAAPILFSPIPGRHLLSWGRWLIPTPAGPGVAGPDHGRVDAGR